MNSFELQKLAQRARSMRETGITLLLASCVLALFLFVPLSSQKQPSITLETVLPTKAFQNTSLEANAAIVYDLVTNKTLYAYNPDAQLPLASLTKLLTVYAAVNELSPQTLITIPESATRLEDAHTFSKGQTLTLTDLARLTLTASLNDGASAIAEAVAHQQNHSEMEMLASAAAALNLSQTYAVNGSGLDVSEALSGGYGSAYDLARLAGALIEKAPAIASATTKEFAEAFSQNGTAYLVKNTDPMIGTIPHLLLSKTGYTELAGGNLALVIDVGIRHPVAIVVLGSSLKARFTDGSALVAATLAHFADVASL